MNDLRVTRSVVIPAHEIGLRATTSGGPGGQHANKVATRVELAWNVDSSEALGPRQRERVRHKLRNRIDSSGTLRLSSDRYRSQLRNKQDVLQRLASLVGEALEPVKRRLPTAPSRAATERRLQDKKRRGDIKRARRVSIYE